MLRFRADAFAGLISKRHRDVNRAAFTRPHANNYNRCMNLGLSEAQSNDLIQYLLSLTF